MKQECRTNPFRYYKSFTVAIFEFWMLFIRKIEYLKEINQIDSLTPTLGFAVINHYLNLIYFDHLSELRFSLLLKSDVNFTWRDVEILRRAFCLHTLLFFTQCLQNVMKKTRFVGKKLTFAFTTCLSCALANFLFLVS